MNTNTTDKKAPAVQLNVRIPQEDQVRFQTLCDKNGLKQADAFTFLLDTFDLQKAAEKNPDRQENLSALKCHLQAVIDLFAGNYAVMDTIKESIREEFAADLKQLSKVEQANTTLVNKQNQLEAELLKIKTEKNNLEHGYADAKKELANKQERIGFLEGQLDKANKNSDIIVSLREENSAHLKEVIALKDKLEQTTEQLTRQALEHERALRDTDNKYRDQIQRLSDERHHALQELAHLSQTAKQ